MQPQPDVNSCRHDLGCRGRACRQHTQQQTILRYFLRTSTKTPATMQHAECMTKMPSGEPVVC
jgi:hypothetical protein